MNSQNKTTPGSASSSGRAQLRLIPWATIGAAGPDTVQVGSRLLPLWELARRTAKRLGFGSPSDLASQMAHLLHLEPGWDEEGGGAPTPLDIRSFFDCLDAATRIGMPTPFVYPEEGGGLVAEWAIPDHELSLHGARPGRLRAHICALSGNRDVEELEFEPERASMHAFVRWVHELVAGQR